MKNFGFNIAIPRAIDLDKADTSLYDQLREQVPSIKRCIMCGACTATCSAGSHTYFNFRKCHLMFQRGQLKGLDGELDKCMLCGKCQLVCPRGVNTRAVVQQMRILIGNITYERKINYAFGQ